MTNHLTVRQVGNALTEVGILTTHTVQTILTEALNAQLNEPQERYDLTVKCVGCKRTYLIQVDKVGFQAWSQDGALIQEAMPELSVEERELLISHTCSPCFDALFPADPDQYADDDHL